MKSIIIAVALALGLTGCGVFQNVGGLFSGETAEHDVFGVGAAYVAVGEAALQYTTLPRCSEAPAPCSEQAAVDRIKEVDTTAYNALKAAQAVAINDPDSNEAASAVNHAFRAILNMESVLLGFGIIEEPVAEAAAEEVS